MIIEVDRADGDDDDDDDDDDEEEVAAGDKAKKCRTFVEQALYCR